MTTQEKGNRLYHNSSLKCFLKSMKIDYEKWHDGIGYDLDAIELASPKEKQEIEQALINHHPLDWRDIEALAKIDSETAREAIKKAISDPNPEVRVAVTRYSSNLVKDSDRVKSIVDALEKAESFGGLSQVLNDVESFHPEEVKKALLKGLLNREGEVAVLFAAMLFYIYGKAKEPFDTSQRPFFLRFNTENRKERKLVFQELCVQLSINCEKYLE